MDKKSIAEQVSEWIERYPYIVWALKNGLINYSSLARKIQRECEIKNFDAVIVAIRRYKDTIKAVKEEGILEIMKKSTLEINTGMNVYTVQSFDPAILKNLKHFHIITGESTTIITSQKLDLSCIKKYENLVEIRIKSPPAIEKTAGVVAYIYGKIAERDINIIETYSAYTDTVFIINKKDLTAMVNTLDSIGVK